MNIVFSIDKRINKFCTVVSHRLQRGTGLTCYFIARVGVGMMGLDVIAEIINAFFRFLPNKTPLVITFICCFVLLMCINRSRLCQRADDTLGEALPRGLMAEIVGELNAFFRVFWLVWAIFDLAIFFAWPPHSLGRFIQQCLFSMGAFIFHNFVAVFPLPPGKSKVSEWIKAMLFRWQPAEAHK
jgi:hypothetical protein